MHTQKKMARTNRQNFLISVVIPTRDRADLLAPALYSLTNQVLDASAFEVLVIDNGSLDRTVEVCHTYTSQLPNLRYFLSPEPGLHVGRHRGLREAKGDLLVFADDDIEALPSWLASIQEAFDSPEVAMVGGNNFPLFMGPPPRWLSTLWERPTRFGGRALPPLSIVEFSGGIGPHDPLFVWGCNFAIRKSVLLEAGGFNPDGMPKELIRFRGDGETAVSRYVMNNHLKCLFHPGASIFHKVPPERMTFEYFRQRGFNQGISDSYTDLRDKYLNGKKSSFKNTVYYQLARRAYQLATGYHLQDADARRALNELGTGRMMGYAYHKRLFKSDPEVHNWVLRENYL